MRKKDRLHSLHVNTYVPQRADVALFKVFLGSPFGSLCDIHSQLVETVGWFVFFPSHPLPLIIGKERKERQR